SDAERAVIREDLERRMISITHD
ncbi:MAG: hypothetical protein JWM68_1649, partial [Verrucomicrobiales bacterium]|nr:hypothetical protein [Verrucomicrobiales bacterium]